MGRVVEGLVPQPDGNERLETVDGALGAPAAYGSSRPCHGVSRWKASANLMLGSPAM